MVTSQDIDRYVALMVKHGLTRLVLTKDGTIEMERPVVPLAPALPAPAPEAPSAGVEEEQPLDVPCPCGHLSEIEHGPSGCLLGCPITACEAPGGQT